MSLRLKLVALVLAFGALAAGVSGCAQSNAQPSNPMLGTWFDDSTGSQYCFVTDSVVAVPWTTPGGGNALKYSCRGGKLDIVSGTEHRVSMVESVTPTALILSDPITQAQQKLLRSATSTTYARKLALGAVRVTKDFGAILAVPEITWVAETPKGDGTEWTAWSPSSLDEYGAVWDWSEVKLAKGRPVVASGGGPNMAYSFTLLRMLPDPEMLAEADLEGMDGAEAPLPSVEPTAGLDYIDVGYSAATAEYPAGTLVYLPGGLVYSLGEGYAIPVAIDKEHEAFVPVTHR